ncbi:hypothetical protein [Cohnella sp. GbtcB17]|uniref:hypothetical protein n=1 Tax=Cohnella sp. GbtcB17 TaxID=2824762 RepID=UPI001C2F46B9|nr:hypothetical protein [Cohnella sp. GbtcB17]
MLATLDAFKRALLIPAAIVDQDEELSAVLSVASTRIEQEIGCELGYSQRVETLDGSGTKYQRLRSFPVHSVSGVKVGGADAEGFEVAASAGMLYRSGGWASGDRNVVVTLTAGYLLPGATPPDGVDPAPAPLPTPIERAAIVLARMIYAGEWGKDSERLGNSYSVTYSKGRPGGLPPVVEALLSPYTRRDRV